MRKAKLESKSLSSLSGTESAANEAANEAAVRARLQDFATAMTGWFWETDDQLRFTYFSPSVEDITGVPAEWHYGKTREDFGIPESVRPEDWEAHLERLRRRQPFSDFVFQRRAPDGVKWMRTSGVPVFDPEGVFQGYRGSAFVITEEIKAKQRGDRLTSAIENFDELFVLWGPDDRLVACNQQFRDINAKVIHSIQPGGLFEDHIRAAMVAGLYPDAEGWEEEWIQIRLRQHRNPGPPFEMQRQNGRWILLSEQQLPDGSTATISTDITERKRAEQELATRHDITNTALATIPDGVQVLDRDLNLVAWNDRLFEVLELPADAILGADNPGEALRRAMAAHSVQLSDDTRARMATLEIMARTSAPLQYEPIQYEQQLASGKWIECRAHPLPSGGALAVYRDIDESKRIFAKMEELASIDGLTGILNRRSFMNRAEAEFARARRYDRDISFLMIDADHFKAINDNHGHAAGDDILRQLATVCGNTLRTSDTLGRLGGEEFAALLPETGADTADMAAERVRHAVAGLTVKAAGTPVSVTVSIGVATTKIAGDDLAGVMADADAAMYQAKSGGRNKVVHFTARTSTPP